MRLSNLFLFIALSVTALSSKAEIIGEEIFYKVGEKDMVGFLAYDSASSKNAPGVLIVHDWMGLTEKTRNKAREVAGLGYVAFAADIYGEGVRPQSVDEAGKLAGQYKSDRKTFRKHLNAAFEVLKKRQEVDKKRLAAIGFCFGGTGVLELARSGAKLNGVVSFHGGLDSPTPGDGKNIKTRVLALHGADDPYVSAQDLAAFESEMRTNKVDWQLIKYGGAVHSFTDKSAGTDNSKGAAYNEKADKRSWEEMKHFMTEVF